MKRILALTLSALTLVGMLAACGGGSDDPEVTVAEFNTTEPVVEDQSVEPVLAMPEGWIAFATLEEDNTVVVNGLNYLRDPMGETVVVSDMDIVTVNAEFEGEISSVTVNGATSISVKVFEEDGVRILYAEPGDSGEDDNTIDITNGATAGTASGVTAGAVNKTAPSVVTTRAPSKTAAGTRTTTKALQTAPQIKTTKPPTATKDPIIAEREGIQNSKDMSSSEKAAALRLLSYKMDENGIFYVEHEPWQKQFGFNQIYDLASPLIQLVYGTIRIKFRYGYVYKLYTEGENKGKVMYDEDKNPIYETDSSGNPIPKDWMIQLWKGRYGLVMLGAEIGVYTKPYNQTAEHYYSAVAEEELVMAMDVYHKNFSTGKIDYLFTRGPEYNWWLTGFVPGSYYEYNNKSEIIAVINMQFPDTEMLDLFTAGMVKAGFSKGTPGRDNPETYTTSGKSIKFCWQYIDQDG